MDVKLFLTPLTEAAEWRKIRERSHMVSLLHTNSIRLCVSVL